MYYHASPAKYIMYTTIQKFGVSKIYFLKVILLFSKDAKIDSKDVTFF